MKLFMSYLYVRLQTFAYDNFKYELLASGVFSCHRNRMQKLVVERRFAVFGRIASAWLVTCYHHHHHQRDC